MRSLFGVMFGSLLCFFAVFSVVVIVVVLLWLLFIFCLSSFVNFLFIIVVIFLFLAFSSVGTWKCVNREVTYVLVCRCVGVQEVLHDLRGMKTFL